VGTRARAWLRIHDSDLTADPRSVPRTRPLPSPARVRPPRRRSADSEYPPKQTLSLPHSMAFPLLLLLLTLSLCLCLFSGFFPLGLNKSEKTRAPGKRLDSAHARSSGTQSSMRDSEELRTICSSYVLTKLYSIKTEREEIMFGGTCFVFHYFDLSLKFGIAAL
jgi:hypothetical protein